MQTKKFSSLANKNFSFFKSETTKCGVLNSDLKTKTLRQYGLNSEDAEEFSVLSEQLDPEDMYVLGFLKGVNRSAMRRMSRAGLFDVDYLQ